MSTSQEKLKTIYQRSNKIAPLIEGLEDKIPEHALDDYYVKLKTIIKEDEDKIQGTYETIAGTKQEVEIDEIFESLPSEKSDSIHRLLILGGAGVGKSTLMQYIAYKWSKGELWEDKFDYVYRIPLKELLRTNWDKYYEKKSDELKNLAHYHLVAELTTEKEKNDYKIEDMPWKKEKTLLLLDGYDEVAHERKRLLKKVFDEIWEHKNIIITSRPNAIDKEMAEKFRRKIENIGLDHDGINQYLTQYFKNNQDNGTALKEFLEKNPSIKGICQIPVNLAMICFIWSNEKSHEVFRKISNLSDLYEQVVDQLGFRYYAKQHPGLNEEDLKNKWKGGKIFLDELQVLQHVAFQGMTGGGFNINDDQRFESLIIPGMTKRDDKNGISIQSSINYFHKKLKRDIPTINKVYKYGLLKPEGIVASKIDDPSNINSTKEETDLQAQNFSFIHLSFQEFLTALYFVTQLKEGTKEQEKVAEFIAQHRNEPRYLMTLKFVAGILSHDPSQEAEQAIKIFWDAILCNIDGVLEFGVEAKITLLMHLLGQAREENILDERIPNLNKVTDLIDSVVLQDIAGWVTQLEQSDYRSDNIIQGLAECFLQNNSVWLEKKSFELQQKINSQLKNPVVKILAEEEITGIIGSMITKFSGEQLSGIFAKTIELLKNYNDTEWQLKKKAIEVITRIYRNIKFDLVIEKENEVLNLLVGIVGISNFTEVSSKAMKEIIQNSQNSGLAERVKTDLQRQFVICRLSEQHTQMWHYPYIIRTSGLDDIQFLKSIIEVLTGLWKTRTEEIEQSVFDNITILVKTFCKSDAQLLFSTIKNFIPLLHSLKKSALEVILDLVKMLDKNDIWWIGENIQTFVQTEYPYDDEFNESVAKIVRELVKLIKQNTHLLQKEIKVLTTLLDVSDEEIQKLALDNIRKLNDPEEKGDIQLSREAREALFECLLHQKEWIRFSALKSISELEKQDWGSNIQLLQSVTNIFSEFFAPYYLGIIFKVKNAKDSKLSSFRASILKYIEELMKLCSQKDIEPSQELIETFIFLLEILSRNSESGSEKISQFLRKLINVYDNKKNQFLKRVLTTYIPLFKNERGSLLKMFNKLIKMCQSDNTEFYWLNQESAPQILSHLMELCLDSNIEILKDFIEALILLIRHQESEYSGLVEKNIIKLVKKCHDKETFLQETIKIFILHVQDSNEGVKMLALEAIMKSTQMGDIDDKKLAENIIHACRPLLKDSDELARSKSILILSNLRKAWEKDSIKIELIKEILDSFADSLQSSNDVVGLLAKVDIVDLVKESDTHGIQLVQTTIKKFDKLLKELNEFFIDYNEEWDEESNDFFEPSNQKKEMMILVFEKITGLGKIYGNTEVQLVKDIIKSFTTYLESPFSQISKCASEKILELIETFHYTNESNIDQSINEDAEFLQIEDFEIQSRALMEIRGKVEKSNLSDLELVQLLKIKLYPLLNDPKEPIRRLAFEEIMNVVKICTGSKTQLVKETILSFSKILQSSSWLGSNLIPESIGKLMIDIDSDSDFQFLKKVLQTLAPSLENPDGFFYKQLSEVIQNIFLKILTFSTDISECLLHQVKPFRDLVKASLLKCLENYLVSFQQLKTSPQTPKSQLDLETIAQTLLENNQIPENGKNEIKQGLFYLQQDTSDSKLKRFRKLLMSELDQIQIFKGPRVIELAMILISKLSDEDSADQKLIKSAKEILNIQLNCLTETRLRWINENQQNLLNLSPEAKVFIKNVFKELLENGEITSLEEEFIINFINQGLTISLTRSGEIMVEGKRDKLKANNFELMFEKIIKNIIEKQQDILAMQYKNNEPIFKRSLQEGGMKQAAVDRKKIFSIIDSREALKSGFWLVTELKPFSPKSSKVILEQRNVFGDHVIYYFVGLEPLRFSPNTTSEQEIRQEIFGSYINGEAYQGELIEVPYEIGWRMLQEKDKTIKEEEVRSRRKDTYFQQELLKRGGEDRDDFVQKQLDKKLEAPHEMLKTILKRVGVQDPQEELLMQDYFRGFVAAFSTAYSGSQAVESGQLTIETYESLFTPSRLFIELISLISFSIGDILPKGLEAVRSYMKKNEIKNQAKLIKEIAVNPVGMDNFAYKMFEKIISVEVQRKRISEAKDEEQLNNTINRIKNFVEPYVKKAKDGIEKSNFKNLLQKEIEKSPAVRLGESDAYKIINEWVKQHKSQMNFQETEKRLIEIIEATLGLPSLSPSQTQTPGPPKGRKNDCCEIF